MTLATGLEISAEKLAHIYRRYRVREMAVFGSAAHGELRPNSDIDVLVEFLPEAEIGWEFFRLEEKLTGLFGRRVDLARSDLGNPGFAKCPARQRSSRGLIAPRSRFCVREADQAGSFENLSFL